MSVPQGSPAGSGLKPRESPAQRKYGDQAEAARDEVQRLVRQCGNFDEARRRLSELDGHPALDLVVAAGDVAAAKRFLDEQEQDPQQQSPTS